MSGERRGLGARSWGDRKDRSRALLVRGFRDRLAGIPPLSKCLPSTLCVLQRSKQMRPLSVEPYSLVGDTDIKQLIIQMII